MVALRSRRLETLFGADLDKLGATNIASLVGSGVAEAFDLDFKESLYGRSDGDKRALAGDVAALANTAGGVIVLGVAENEQAVAAAADGVEITDAEANRIRQIVASGVSPMPTFDVLSVPLPTDTSSKTTGFFIIAVARSLNAPHAVIVNEGFRYPVRNGSTTRYLSEPEVAAAYRDRLAGKDAQYRRLVAVGTVAREGLSYGEMPWILVTLVPDLPGNMEINRVSANNLEARTFGKDAHDIVHYDVTFKRVRVGRGLIIADDSLGSARARYVAAEYHADGSGSYAAALPDLWGSQRKLNRETSGVANLLVSDEFAAITLLSGLRRLAVHARDVAAAGGNAVLQASLVPHNDRKMEIGHSRGFTESRSTNAQSAVVTAETVAALDDLVFPGPALVAAAARLLDDLGQSFGIPEMGQFAPDGRIRSQYWTPRAQAAMQTWAVNHGIEVTSESLT